MHKIKIIPTTKNMSAEELARKKREAAQDAACLEAAKQMARRQAAERLDKLRIECAEPTLANRAGKAPNLVRTWRELQDKYSRRIYREGVGVSVVRDVFCGRRVGLATYLYASESMPFWASVLASLGADVVVCDFDSKRKYARAAASIPAESVCDPAKKIHGKIHDLIDAGCEFIFMPKGLSQMRKLGEACAREGSGAECAVRCDYAQVIAANEADIREGRVQMVSPAFARELASEIFADKMDMQTFTSCLNQFFGEGAVSPHDIEAAFLAGIRNFNAYAAELADAATCARAWLDADSNRPAVVVVARPYMLTSDVLGDMDEFISAQGVAVMPADMYVDNADFDYILRHAARRGHMGIAAIRSFNCGFDAIDNTSRKAASANVGVPFVDIKLDELTDKTHTQTQLRTLIELSRADMPARTKASPVAEPDLADKTICTVATLQTTTADDINLMRQLVPTDVCTTAGILAARAYQALKSVPIANTVELPLTCLGCQTPKIADLLSSKLGRKIEVRFVATNGEGGAMPCVCTSAPAPQVPRSAPQQSSGTGSLHESLSNRPKFGIIANPLMCFDEYLNEHLADTLHSLGVDVIFPRIDNLYDMDSGFTRQFDEFALAGVRGVVVLSNLSCVAAVVYVKGRLRELQQKYPKMSITVLDFDPRSSSLNRENQIRLAVSAVKN